MTVLTESINSEVDSVSAERSESCVTFPTNDLTVTLANSITLTPGTLALDVHKGEITVHALTKAGADELRKNEMDRRIQALREK